jgi:hypothetical protein
MSSSPTDAKAEARETARKNNPLENATTLRGIYNTGYAFPEWVLQQDRWNETGEKSHKFDDTIVVYDDDSDLNQVKELVEQREPVNMCIKGVMERMYNQNELETNFGWKTGAYGNPTTSQLYPNIGIYCHARVTNDVNKGAEEKDVHVMNLIGYGFDSIEQPDYQYFLKTYGVGKSDLKNLDSDPKQKFKEDLIQRYRKIWLKACYICKLKGLKNLWYYGVGNNNFSAFLPVEWALATNFYNQIFAEAFGIDPADSSRLNSTNAGSDQDIPINFCNQYGIKVLNLQKEEKQDAAKQIPGVLFHKDSTPANTLYINAWDPWSIIGNGNAGDTSLDGYWGRNSNMSVLGWSMTNSKLLPDIAGDASAETSKILSMKKILAKIEAKDASSSSASPPVSSDSTPPPTLNCTIENPDTPSASIQNITPECQQDIFGSVPSKSSEPDILKKHLSVLRTDTQYATDQDLPPGSATIVDLSYYRTNFAYPNDRVKLGTQYVKVTNGTNITIEEKDVNSFNKEISFVIQAAPAGFNAVNISNQSVTNSVYNCLYLANANGVKGIAFPIIGGNIFFSELKITKNQLYEILLQGVADYFKDFTSSKIEIVLFAGSIRVDENDDFSRTFDDFVNKNQIVKDKLKKIETGIFSAYYQYNNNGSNTTKITALVNAANTQITFNGVSGLALGFKNMLGGVGKKDENTLYTLHSKETGLDEKIFTISDDITKEGEKIKKEFKAAVDAYIKNPSAAASPPPPSPPPPPPKPAPAPPKRSFTDVLDTLEGKLNDEGDKSVVLNTLGITSVKDDNFLYPTDGDAANKKNLNSADPAIDVMIKGFESAVDGDNTNFYLGACRSIQAAYDLERGDKKDDSNEGMRAKLLLNLRKNSLLLKVPARWDYVTIQPGKEPEPVSNPEDKKKYEELQKKCKELNGDYASEDAYKLAEQLIPLDAKIENNKLKVKNKFVEENYPENKITYTTIADVVGGFRVIIVQHAENCGRAALANFFGTEDFLIKGDPTNTEEIFNLKIQRPPKIDMSSICHLNKKYSDIFAEAPNNPEDKEDNEYVTKCPTSENYSINVLSIVLQVLGYKDLTGITFNKQNMKQYNENKAKLNESYDNKDVLGYLVNINKGHWVCYKRENLGSTTNSFYRIDSMTGTNFKDARTLDKLVEYDSTTLNKNFIQLHPITKNDDSNNQKIFSKLTNIDEGKKNYYTDIITRNEINEKWKLFKKDVTSLLVKESIYSNDINNQVRIMNYLSNLPSNKSNTNNDIQIGLNDEHVKYGSIQSKILSLTPEKKQQVIDIFIQNIKKNLNTLKFITANNRNLRNIAYDKDINLYEPDSDAKNRYYYSLTQTCNYKTGAGADFSKDLTSNGYYKSANTLLESIDILFKSPEFNSSASPASGGSKPTHIATAIHATSKSKHNTSFKASSSKTKGKSHNRSHTQRVK